MKLLKQMTCLALAVAALAFSPTIANAEGENGNFKVTNTTKTKIVKLLASENGKDYGNFDLGDGIAPGKTVTLNWGKNTKDTGCKWFLKAVFSDGEESEAQKFDFCEDDLELEF
ncbi:MAG: hypothetical protein M3Y69_01180 [Verrucomicrobiota bacterium]|nr:hypothetical protein [Verrucomicrobiota bacterium]